MAQLQLAEFLMSNLHKTNIRAVTGRRHGHLLSALSAVETGVVVVECDGSIALFDDSATVAWSGTARWALVPDK
jgi:hypothetical protein